MNSFDFDPDDDRDYERERDEACEEAIVWGDSFDYDDWEPPSTTGWGDD